MLVHIKEIVGKAQKGHYAVGAFNIHNLESVLGVAQAAVRAGSPAIIQVSEGAIKYMGIKPITHIVSTVAKNVAASVPIALHLDHGNSFDAVFECIKAGFSSVHIDASSLPLDENIDLTKSVVEIARGKNVWVQGEVGANMGGHGQVSGRLEHIPVAKVSEVIRFVEETRVDTIAAAVGTAHGVFDNEDIRMDLLKEIKQKTKIPFVLHGGSGVDAQKIKESIKHGVNIINIGTEIKLAFSETLKKTCAENPNETDPRNLLRPTIKAVEEAVYAQMRLFGSCGRYGEGDVET